VLYDGMDDAFDTAFAVWPERYGWAKGGRGERSTEGREGRRNKE
jgi:hypothetical protein